jgi:DNA-binding transcriptional regulator YiaG
MDHDLTSCCSPSPIQIPALPFIRVELRAPKPPSEQYPKELNAIGDHIRKRRPDLNLLQRQAADRIGVHHTTITNWERKACVSAIRFMPSIIHFLGYDPSPPAISLRDQLVSVRKGLGLSQRKMAERIGVDPATLQGWESGEHRPARRRAKLILKTLQRD